MTSQPVEANVVLTADNAQYDQAMDQSSVSTGNLGKAIDSLGQKINALSKTAGKGLIGITAADVAVITGATAAWSAYEKQVSRLQAQSAVLTRTNTAQERVMKDYTKAVGDLRKEYGTTTGEAAKLVETLSKITNVKQTRQLTDLSKVFVDMSHATGESSEGLANSLTNLQKLMGAPINVKTSRDYTDMFTTLAASTNTSATALADFTAQLAPVGDMMGMSGKQVAGFATAFTRAGQDALPAATVFNKVATDITKSLQSGSGEVAHYANLVGMSQDKFKQMDGANQMVLIFEALQSKGAAAATELNRLGLDGPRSMKAVTAVINQAGGIRQALGESEGAYGSGSAAKGAAASTRGLSDEFAKLREEMKKTAETFGSYFGPPLEKFMQQVVKIAGFVRELAEGPLGKLAAAIAAIVAPFAAGAGAMLLFAGALLKIAAAFTLFRSSASYGLREGLAGGSSMVRTAQGTYIARGAGTLGARGAEIAQDPRSTWFQRGSYNLAQAGGAGIAGLGGLTRSGYIAGRQMAQPGWTPPPIRSALSYVAGGAGALIRQGVTPAFDQMRYQNVMDRTRWVGHEAPWATRPQVTTLSRAMGAVGDEESRKSALMQRTREVYRDPFMSQDERKAQMANLKALHQESNTRLATARATEQAAQQSIVAQQQNTQQQKLNTQGMRGFGQSLRGLAGGMAGGVLGAGRAGGSALMRSGMAPQAGAGLAMAGMASAGVDSSMLMLGAMGTMLLPGIGTAAGMGVGAALDMAKANDKATDSVKALKEQADEIAKSGSGLSQMDTVIKDSSDSILTMEKDFDKVTKGSPGLGGLFGVNVGTIMHPVATFGGAKNAIEGLFGDSDVKELSDDQEEYAGKIKDTETAVRDLAKATGTPITGTRDNQLKQLEEFISTSGAQRLSQAGVDLKDLVLSSKMGGDAYESMISKIVYAGKESGMWDRLREGGGIGAAMISDADVQRSLRFQENVEFGYKANHKVFDESVQAGKSYLQIMKEATIARHNIGESNVEEAERASAYFDMAAQREGLQVQQLGRVGQFQRTIAQGQVLMGTPTEGMTDVDREALEAGRMGSLSAVGDMMSYFRQMLLAQDQYELSRKRAQEDYHTMRVNQEYDYNLSRTRANESFERSRRRSVQDFHRGQERAQYQFNLQRSRAEDDFTHQIEVNAKQQAMSVMSVYERVKTERTSSIEYILANAQDQVRRMQEQEANLETLRARGVSDETIQQMDLTNPQMAQQLARTVTETAGEQGAAIVKRMNETIGTQRIDAAKALVTDESSLSWKETERGFRQSMTRGAEDFELQMKQSKQDFRRGLNQNREDFNIMMGQQAEDYDHGLHVQEKAYKRSMDRAAEDMANMANEILLTNEQVLTQSTERLTGAAQKQARQVKRSLKKLSEDTKPEAIAFMTELAAIYGFEYTAPTTATGTTTGEGAGRTPINVSADNPITPNAPTQHPSTSSTAGGQAGFHEGGTVPGWSPGRDTQMVPLSGGEAIMRPEWARAMGKDQIDQMNHHAKHGGFAEGGVVWPVPGHTTGTYPGHDGVDINRGSGSDDLGDTIRAFRDGTITYVGTAHGYGEAIFEKTAAGTVVYGHTSAQSVTAGQKVTAGQAIGEVGSTGNSSSPHLHFGIPGGTYEQAMALLEGAIVGGGPGDFGGGLLGMVSQAAQRVQAMELLKKRYPKAEESAWGMKGVHSLKPGMISELMNRFAKKKIRALAGAGLGMGDQVGEFSTNIGNQPKENLSNEEIVHTGANRIGWGDQWSSLYQLLMKESGFNPTAQNPTSTAYGMFQFTDGTWAGTGIKKTSDPWKQTQAGLKYIKNRYDDPNGAWDFWQTHNWYGDGAVFNGAQTIGVGESGPEAVIPLNQRGGEFMADVMARSVGMGSTPAGSMAVYNTKVDKSTVFSGPITVQANNPEELIAKLQSRQRVMALSRPSLTGSAA
jgi:TP901 family phage tail tape measure protein